MIVVAGIDPGTQRAGYAAIGLARLGAPAEILDLGYWDLVGKGRGRPSVGLRLEQLHGEASAFFKKWNPRLIGFEKAVTFKNVASALTLSEARGVVRLAAYGTLASVDQRLIELSPTAVKKEVAGFGLSGKGGVQKGLALRFRGLERYAPGGEDEGTLSPDAFDALAIAWTAWVRQGRGLLVAAPNREARS